MPTRSSLRGLILTAPESALALEILASADAIDAAAWNRLVPGSDGRPDNPFLEHAFFVALERSGSASAKSGWQPQHLVLKTLAGAIRGIMPLYLKSHSQGEYVFDHGWADAFERAGGSYYPKLLSAVPFTPVTGPRLLAEDDDTRAALLLASAKLADSNDLSSVHATFLTEAEARLAGDAGWLLRHDTQFHWTNDGHTDFEGFLGALSSRHRKQVRRERREAVEGLTIRWLSGADLTEAVWDAFFEFYMDTGSRKWGRPYLNRRFFSLLSQAIADRVLLMFAYDGDEPVAGTLSLVGRDTLYGRYWGATRQVPFLHFELCYYQAIDYALAHGLGRVEAGAQGEHKLARGYAPATTRSAHWIGHEGLRHAVARFLVEERQAVERGQEILSRYAPFRKGDPPHQD
jgi:predicted N-acyltransferase